MPKVRYISRSLIDGPYVGLCLDESSFKAELKRLKVAEYLWPRALSEGSQAELHSLRNQKGNTVFLICMKRNPKLSQIERYAILVHEAVHVWQKWAREIGAEGAYEPGDEFEAYAIQNISQRLMEAFEGK